MALKGEIKSQHGKTREALEAMCEYTPFYSCGGVLQWVNVMATPTAGVQINMENIDQIISQTMPASGPPDKLMQPLVVVVPEAKYDPEQHFGAMKLASPLEFVLAALKACARDVQKGLADADARKWKHVFQTVQMDFVFLAEAIVPMYAFHLREQYLQAGESVGWSMLQRVQMIIREKHSLEVRAGGKKCSAARLSAVFSNSVRLAASSEKMSAAVIDIALTIESRVLSIDACRAMLEEMDQRWGLRGPFDSVYKLQALINKAKTPATIRWVMASLFDSLRMGILEVGDFSVKKLEKEWCPLAIMKNQFHEYLLSTFLDSHNFSIEGKTKLREVFADHASVRRMVAAYPDSGRSVELAWQGFLPPSITRVSELIEGICFSDMHDTSLKTAAKYHKSVTDALAYNPVQEDITGILEALQAEVQAAGASTANSVGGERAAEKGAATGNDNNSPADVVIVDAPSKKVQEKMNEMTADDQDHWNSAADRLMRQYIRIVVFTGSQPELVLGWEPRACVSWFHFVFVFGSLLSPSWLSPPPCWSGCVVVSIMRLGLFRELVQTATATCGDDNNHENNNDDDDKNKTKRQQQH